MDEEGIRQHFIQEMDAAANDFRDKVREASGSVSPSEHAAALAKTCDTKKNAEDVCGNGDQSKLLPTLLDRKTLNDPNAALDMSAVMANFSDPGQILRNVWAAGADFGPWNLSSFHWACYAGDVGLVEKGISLVANTAPTTLTQLLETRETQLRFSALMTTVAGSRFLPGSKVFQPGVLPAEVIAKADHVRVVRLLLEAGARVDVKDVAGFTLLHHCTTTMATPRSLEIALLLAEHGADANSTNRFGDLPLFEATMNGIETNVAVLLETGADPFKNSDINHSAYSLARLRPNLLSAFIAWRTRHASSGSGKLVGRQVELVQLNNKSRNGQVGRCEALNSSTGRYSVLLEGEEVPIAVKGGNLRPADAFEGKRIVLQKLKKEEMNGKMGTCGEFDHESGRYVVELDGNGDEEGTQIRVKRENLKSGKGACACCGKEKEAGKKLSKCSGCMLVGYCGAECQRAHWKSHKKTCRAEQSGMAVFKPWGKDPGFVLNLAGYKAGQAGSKGTGKKKEEKGNDYSKPQQRVVKVQVPLGLQALPDTTSTNRQMKCYSRSFDIDYWIDMETNPEEYATVERVIFTKGIGSGGGMQGNKAYFNAYIDQQGCLVLDHSNVLPPQPW